MTHDEIRERLAAFALDLLEGGEAAEVATHAGECAECRAELQVYAQAGDALSVGVEPVALAPDVMARIASGVRARLEPREQAQVVNLGERRAARWRWLSLATAAAFLLVAVGLTATTVAWLSARQDVDDLETRVALLERDLARRPLELPLVGADVSGVIFVRANFEGGVAAFSGLEPAPSGHHYQVWSEGPEGTRAAAAFVAGGDEVVLLPALPETMTRMFVTLEEDGAPATEPGGPEILSTP